MASSSSSWEWHSGRHRGPCSGPSPVSTPDPEARGQLTVLWKGGSRVVSSSPGGPPKGFRAEPGSYMEKAWRSLRWVLPPGPTGVCSTRSLGSGAVGAGPGGCRICKFSACSLWI